MFAGIHRLRYQEFAILRRGVFLPLYDHPIVQNALFQAIIDISMSFVAFAAAFSMATGRAVFTQEGDEYRYLLLAIPLMQTAVFFVSGMYRVVLRHAGIDDMMRVIKSVGISVIFGGLVFAALGYPMSERILRIALFDFFFLTSLLIFSRFSYVVLRELARDTMEGKDPVVVYGAGDRGVAAMRALLAAPELHMRPVGFLDDDARVEGKKIHGLPVFGGHWRLERLIIARGIKAVVIAADAIHPVAQRRIKALSSMYRVPVRVFGATFTDLPVEVVEAPTFRVHLNDSTETPLDHAQQQMVISRGGGK
jgi:FlaA1/EpsC-like NDP-sugar epimerase